MRAFTTMLSWLTQKNCVQEPESSDEALQIFQWKRRPQGTTTKRSESYCDLALAFGGFL
jgi:hypothetical protein